MANSKNKDNDVMKYSMAAVVVVIIAGVLFLSLNGGAQSTSVGSSNLSIQLTDPPLVPVGTQSLVITYSGVDLHEAGASNSTGFVDFNASGTANLMDLANVSQTVAVIKAQANQSFNMIRFDIRSAVITINNATYNVTVASGGVLARINSSVNATASGGVLLDLSPTVLQVYTATNQSIFIMVPSARAVEIGKNIVSGNLGRHVGDSVALKGELATAIFAQRANISITSATASEAGNVTRLRITVRNNGNTSTQLSDVVVRGFMEVIPASDGWTPPPGVEISAAVQARPMAEPMMLSENGSVSAAAGMGSGFTGTYLNTSANGSGSVTVAPIAPLNSSLNATVAADMNAGSAGYGGIPSRSVALGVGEAEIFNRDFHNQLNFIVEANGTMELPYAMAMIACPAIIVSGISNASAIRTPVPGCGKQNSGYALAAGATANLTFSGVITMPNIGVVVSSGGGIPVPLPSNVSMGVAGGAAGVSTVAPIPTSPVGEVGIIGPRVRSATVVLIPNQTYDISVHGSHGAYAHVKATATGYATNYRSELVDVTNVDLGLHNTSSGVTYNETMAGFISHSNSTVSYSVYSYGGIYAMMLPRLPSYTLNVTGFQVNTAGFTLLNWSVILYPPPPCPVCMPGKVCPMYACVAGTGKAYLLHIKVPQSNYTGALSITEDFGA